MRLKKMNKTIFISLFCLFSIFTSATIMFSQNVDFGAGIDFSGVGGGPQRIIVKSSDTFITKIAEKFDYDEEKLQKLFHNGYGRNELIKLILITEESAKPFNDILKLREKPMPLRKIARKYEIDYRFIYDEAKKIELELKGE